MALTFTSLDCAFAPTFHSQYLYMHNILTLAEFYSFQIKYSELLHL